MSTSEIILLIFTRHARLEFIMVVIKVHAFSICNKYYTKNELIVSITLDVYLMFMRSLTQYEGNTCRTIQFIKICQICLYNY